MACRLGRGGGGGLVHPGGELCAGVPPPAAATARQHPTHTAGHIPPPRPCVVEACWSAGVLCCAVRRRDCRACVQDMILKKIKAGDTAALSVREVRGVITLEDILEEMIQAEIVDEHDTFVANDSMQRVHKVRPVRPCAARSCDGAAYRPAAAARPVGRASHSNQPAVLHCQGVRQCARTKSPGSEVPPVCYRRGFIADADISGMARCPDTSAVSRESGSAAVRVCACVVTLLCVRAGAGAAGPRGIPVPVRAQGA